MDIGLKVIILKSERAKHQHLVPLSCTTTILCTRNKVFCLEQCRNETDILSGNPTSSFNK